MSVDKGYNNRQSDLSSKVIGVILVLLILVCILIAYNDTKEYSVPVIANLSISTYYEQEGREVIGYTHHYGLRVYNKPYEMPHYKTQYIYSFDGNTYTTDIWRSYKEPKETIRLYVNPNNPEDVIISSDKVSLKELLYQITEN